ncbi:hypothetical protein SASPL_155824 [Salvia splendens]|uniref:Jasmonate O-methyltransferase n=1 Tax=Salvia splendens TaxID=180675 RepID=A0A8X8YYM3_SALSN|nr:hypothetical protein SASPL_155824 [Salvia splendens]
MAVNSFMNTCNDLPTNDFNTLFKTLPDFYQDLNKGNNNPSVLVAAYPGTFYGRLFPPKSLHCVFSFCALQWLSRNELERFEIVEKEIDLSFSGVVMAKAVRAVQQSMISHHFGEGIMDELFDEYAKLLDKEIATKNYKVIRIAVVLTKL